MDDVRYSVYLIPPKDVVDQVDRIRTRLSEEFGFQAATRFMVHATLKGFFKLNGDIEEHINALDDCLQQQRCFEIRMTSIGTFPGMVIKIGIKSWTDGNEIPNTKLRNLHKDVYQAIQNEPILPEQIRGIAGRGFIAEDCDFTPREYIGAKFSAHFTLAFMDVAADTFRHALECAKHEFQSVHPRTFSEGTSVGLYQFHSVNWHEKWWETLTFDEVRKWRLV